MTELCSSPSVRQQQCSVVCFHRGSRTRPQPRYEPRRWAAVHVPHRRLHHELWSHVRRTCMAHTHRCVTFLPHVSPPLCRGSKNFSSCSADDFENMMMTGGTCLLNVPRPDEAYSAPSCGNRLVDFGEECDCGSEKVRGSSNIQR